MRYSVCDDVANNMLDEQRADARDRFLGELASRLGREPTDEEIDEAEEEKFLEDRMYVLGF